MCGIVGYVGKENAVPYLINGLKKLEYRGYDSSGIVVGKIEGGEPKFYLYKKAGKLSQLVGVLPKELSGSWGIGHTRWATHGMVTDLNAHPFYGNRNKVAAVHNGIIENFQQLRADLQKEGVEFSSETDSEVIPNLVEKHYSGDLLDAVQKALN
ncbi:MAG: glutamine--fructose-6-phosphate aminotransferase, partial [Treponema porcinum]|nr:glutamine--fructose-6-phosphate aminotransferase [Treponema porcinum]